MGQPNRRRMGWWSSFLDSLDTGGGHIFVLLVLIGFGSFMFFKDATAGGQIITLAFGALLALTKATKSNREAMNGDGDDDTTTTVTATSTTTPHPPDPVVPPVGLTEVPPGATVDGGVVHLGQPPMAPPLTQP